MAKYDEWLTDNGQLRIESWASDGLTNADIAYNMDVRPETFSRWLSAHPQINQALKRGRVPVSRKLENSLIKKALGFEYEEVTTEIWVDAAGKERKKAMKHSRYSLPDTTAAIFLLKNYKPEKYRNYNEMTKRKMEAEIQQVLMETKKLEAEIASNDTLETKLDQLLSAVEEQVDNGTT